MQTIFKGVNTGVCTLMNVSNKKDHILYHNTILSGKKSVGSSIKKNMYTETLS